MAKKPTVADVVKEDLVRLAAPSINKGESSLVKSFHGIDNKKRYKWGGYLGAGVGLLKTAMDDTDDNLGSTLGKVATGAALGMGANLAANLFMDSTNLGRELAGKATINKLSRAEMEVDGVRKSSEVAYNDQKKGRVSTSDVAKIDGEHKTNEAKYKNAKIKKMKNWTGKAKIAGAIGLGAFAAASAMDASQRLDNKSDASRMTGEQERRVQKKRKQEEKNQQQHAYGYMDMGDIVGELFNNRIGHHKMGNAKFQ